MKSGVEVYWGRVVLSHPSHKDKNVARMGHPDFG